MLSIRRCKVNKAVKTWINNTRVVTMAAGLDGPIVAIMHVIASMTSMMITMPSRGGR